MLCLSELELRRRFESVHRRGEEEQIYSIRLTTASFVPGRIASEVRKPVKLSPKSIVIHVNYHHVNSHHVNLNSSAESMRREEGTVFEEIASMKAVVSQNRELC